MRRTPGARSTTRQARGRGAARGRRPRSSAALLVPRLLREARDRGWWDPLRAGGVRGVDAPRRSRPSANRTVVPSVDRADLGRSGARAARHRAGRRRRRPRARRRGPRGRGAASRPRRSARPVVGHRGRRRPSTRPMRDLLALGVAPGASAPGPGRRARCAGQSGADCAPRSTAGRARPLEPLDRTTRAAIARRLLERAGFSWDRRDGASARVDPSRDPGGALMRVRTRVGLPARDLVDVRLERRDRARAAARSASSVRGRSGRCSTRSSPSACSTSAFRGELERTQGFCRRHVAELVAGRPARTGRDPRLVDPLRRDAATPARADPRRPSGRRAAALRTPAGGSPGSGRRASPAPGRPPSRRRSRRRPSGPRDPPGRTRRRGRAVLPRRPAGALVASAGGDAAFAAVAAAPGRADRGPAPRLEGFADHSAPRPPPPADRRRRHGRRRGGTTPRRAGRRPQSDRPRRVAHRRRSGRGDGPVSR